MDVFYRRGLWIEIDGKRLLFDPNSSQMMDEADAVFVSHGHADHTGAFKNVSLVNAVSSGITAEVLKEKYGVSVDQLDSCAELHNAGHVMGSTQFLIGDVLYTGDINTTEQLSVPPAEAVSADTLIIEATYGVPGTVFPSHESVLEQINRFVDEAFSQDRPAVFYAYSLGKAQELSLLLQNRKLFVDSEIYRMNSIYSSNVKNVKCHPLLEGMQFERNDFVAIFTASKMRQNKHLLAKNWCTNAPMTAVATGWATVDWFRNGVTSNCQLDRVFPLSSHADFNGLCDFVDAVSPKKVYTVYGATAELAKALKKKGYDAEPVRAVKAEQQTVLQKCRAY